MKYQTQQMTLAKFYGLMTKAAGIKIFETAEDLLEKSLTIIDADTAFLIKHVSSGFSRQNYSIEAVWPPGQKGWVRDNHREILNTLLGDVSDPDQESRGIFLENKELKTGSKIIPDALAAFEGHNEPPFFWIVLLREKEHEEFFNSYHTWIAQFLLKKYTSVQTQTILKQTQTILEMQRKLKERHILEDRRRFPPISFGDLKKRLEKLNNDLKDNDLKCIELPACAARWVISCLKESFWFEKEFIENGQKLINKINRYCRSSHEWKTVNKPIFKAISKTPQPGLSNEDISALKKLSILLINAGTITRENWKSWRDIAGMASLYAWLAIIEQITSKQTGSKEELYEIVDSAIELSRCWLAHELALECTSGQNFLLNRNTLRLYFGWLLLSADSLKERYRLKSGPKNGNKEREMAFPFDLKLDFIFHLSHYLVQTVDHALIEGTSPEFGYRELVSPGEGLDALLYLVDRYGHDELGIPPWLNIRKHLGQGAYAEIEHYMTRPFYRDHLLHVIDVFLTGHLLLETRLNRLGGEPRTLLAHLPYLFKGKTTKSVPGNLVKNWKKNWAVAALFHDIGYQLGDKKTIEKDTDRVKQFFGLRGSVKVKHLDPETTDERDERQNRAYDYLSRLLNDFYSLKKKDSWLPEQETYLISDYDHGILSSLRVAQLLLHHNNSRKKDEKPITEMIESYHHALHAIAHHNLFAHPVRMATHPLACLLRFCDEIQDWARKRVDMDRIIRNLYIAIDQNSLESAGGKESLRGIEANLEVKISNGSDISFESATPRLKFKMLYKDSTVAGFDVITTFLSKAYNLQHLDLDIPKIKRGAPIEWDLDLWFPQPEEYERIGFCETGIYTRFIQEARELPPLSLWDSLESPPGPGLFVLKPYEGQYPLKSRTDTWPTFQSPASGKVMKQMDRIGIVVSGKAEQENRTGWLDIDPSDFFKQLIAFKERLFLNRKNDLLSVRQSGTGQH